jgi:Domain of unknown function (DUF4118)
MPFSLGFQFYPWVERVLRVRKNPLATYGLALTMVALAVVVRWLVAEHAGAQVFTTFYPAIIIAALFGGLRPGIFATVLSTVAAWYFLVPRFFALPVGGQLPELTLFVVIRSLDVGVAVLVNVIVDRLVIQQRNVQLLLEAAPNGFVSVDGQGTIKLVMLAGCERLHANDMEAIVPLREGTSGYAEHDREKYKWRHLVENFFCSIKAFRRIATRYEKTDKCFAAIINLVAKG